MNKRKLLMGAGALLLAVSGIIAGRASTKFAVPTRIYYETTGGTCKTLASAITVVSQRLTTVAGGGTAATLLTQGNAANLAIFATSTCVKQVYFYPNR